MNLRRCVASFVLMLMAVGCGNQGSNQGAATAAGGSPAGLTWQRYQDPLENAFTLEVPNGWTVKGGMFRLGYSDHRAMVDMTSPDGKINIRLGDLAIPTYFLP